MPVLQVLATKQPRASERCFDDWPRFLSWDEARLPPELTEATMRAVVEVYSGRRRRSRTALRSVPAAGWLGRYGNPERPGSWIMVSVATGAWTTSKTSSRRPPLRGRQVGLDHECLASAGPLSTGFDNRGTEVARIETWSNLPEAEEACSGRSRVARAGTYRQLSRAKANSPASAMPTFYNAHQ